MNLTIDVGNTRVKTAVFKNKKQLTRFSFQKKDLATNVFKIKKTYNFKYAIISNVASIDKEEINILKKNIFLLELSPKINLPFKIKYNTPNTLGVDRIALVANASQKFKNRDCLIIDAGTCITYDFLTKENEYLGGAIAPGIQLRYKSLNKYTANLPLLNNVEAADLVGNSTKESIKSGVINGVLGEIDATVKKYKNSYPNLTVVLTGGDTNFLAKNIKSSIFANPDFLLEGLNEILTYNTEE